MNQTEQIIRLTGDPELKVTQDGKSICTFSGAYNEKYKGKEKVSYFNYVAFDKTAEIINQYVSKGQQIGIVSKAQQDRWEDKDGNKRNTIKFIVNSFTFIGEKKNNESQPEPVPDVSYREKDSAPSPFSDTDIPF